jgi:hypothetical protein
MFDFYAHVGTFIARPSRSPITIKRNYLFVRHRNAKVRCFHLGTLSPNPWDLSLLRQNAARRAACAAPPFRLLSRRSGRIPALPYPPPRLGQYKSVAHSRRKNVCPNNLPQGINTLVLVPLRWPVLKCPRMAGFQTSTEGAPRTELWFLGNRFF